MNRPRTPSSGAGPGRHRSRSRVERRLHASAGPSVHRPEPPEPAPVSPVRRIGVTRRAVALAAALVILAVSYASSLRIYFETERDKAADAQRIARSEENIAALDAELRRWNDPDHVAAQARSRLGWVVPGDTSYRVIGPDGEVLGVDDTPGTQPDAPPPGPWYGRMTDSVTHADQPPTLPPISEPDRVDPADRPPITNEGN